jgi:hypothetical protein
MLSCEGPFGLMMPVFLLLWGLLCWWWSRGAGCLCVLLQLGPPQALMLLKAGW